MKFIKLLLPLLLLLVFSQAETAESAAFEDTLFEKQWALKNSGQTILRANSELGRDHVLGTPGSDLNWVSLKDKNIPSDRQVIVAVVDTGVDVTHPDLKGRIWINKTKCPNEIELGKGCHGYDFLENKGSVTDEVGHGTHVAGIIAANANKIGIAGIAHPQIIIMPVKVLNNQVTDFVYKKKVLITDIIANGILYAIEKGADVINLSIGWPQIVETPKIKKALGLALQKEIPVIAAAGNNNKEVPTFPCTNLGVICVGAVDNQGKLTEFSNYGGKIDILAPGEFIVSTYPSKVESRKLRISGNEAKKGTSQAAPYITGIVASLKLLNPKISLDEVRARLFANARPVSTSNTADKFSNIGLVDMKKTLEELPGSFLAPILKNLLEITYSSDQKKFLLRVPIKNYLEKLEENITIDIRVDSKAIKLEESTKSLAALRSREEKKVTFVGSVIRTDLDSTIPIEITVKAGDHFKRIFKTSLFFSNDITRSKDLIKNSIPGIDSRRVLVFNKFGKFTSLLRVSDRYNRHGGFEEFFIDKRKQTETETVISMISANPEKVGVRDLKMKKNGQVLTITRVDVNLDGSPDYMVYSKNSVPGEFKLYFSFFDKDFKPLFGKNSTWTHQLTTFGGLPIKNGFEADFHWIKKESKELGTILVPAMYRTWLMPEEDNTDDLLDRIPENLKDQHLYYLNPSLVKEGDEEKVVLKVRALDGFNFYQKFKEDQNVFFDESVSLQTPFAQSISSSNAGTVKAVIAVGVEFSKRYYIVTFEGTDKYRVEPIAVPLSYIAQNNVFPILNSGNGMASDASAFMVLYDRKTTRIHMLNPETKKQSVFSYVSHSWGDMLFGYLAGFTGKSDSLFIESRYNVVSMLEDGSSAKLPINRDSAFPGVQFTETLDILTVKKDGKSLPAVYVDATKIFGDRLYSMVQTESEFIRPLSLSVKIPKNCRNFRPSFWGQNSGQHYTMLCIEKGNKLSLSLYPALLK